LADTPKMAAADTLRGRALLDATVARELRVAPPSIAEVYEANFDYVFRCLRSLGVRADQLDDAVHDVFMVVQDKLAAFDGQAQLRTWIYAIVLRVARRYRARAAHEANKFVAVEPGIEDARVERSVEHGERLALARAALEALDDEKREVFVLSRVEQMSAPEIAEITGLPLNTVYSRLRAARLAFSAQVTRLSLLGVTRRAR
jgi:RNA polymerase sigma-70 factor, ECF subfamily